MLQSLARPTRLTRVPCIPDIPPFFAQARISSSPRCSSEGFSSCGLRGVWFGFCLSSVRECRSVCRCHPALPVNLECPAPQPDSRKPRAPLSCDQVSSALLSSGFDSRASGTKPFCFLIAAVRVRVGVLEERIGPL